MVPFMGREKEPYAYEPFRIYDYKDSVKMQVAEPYRYPAKVYRKTFSRNKELQKMIEQIPETDLPVFMRDSRIKDVTADYLPVTDVKVELNKRVHSGEQVYLAVYSDDWTITAWAEQQEEKIAYFNIGENKCSAKLPSDFHTGENLELSISSDDLYFFDRKTGKRI